MSHVIPYLFYFIFISLAKEDQRVNPDVKGGTSCIPLIGRDTRKGH